MFVYILQMPQIHLFNPGHETAVLSGSESYTPPQNVRKIQRDLALLPLWYADTGDCVWIGETSDLSFLSALPDTLVPAVIPATTGSVPMEGLTAAPWGLSPQSLRFFRDINRKEGTHINVPVWEADYARLTGRQTAAICLDRMREQLIGYALPATPVFCNTIDEVEACLPAYTGSCLLKTPFSSSGRGLMWLTGNRLSAKDREWIGGALQKQGCVSVEQGLDNVHDFAMEFHIDPEGNVRYEGLSVFATTGNGAYAGNRLEAQEYMLEKLIEPVGTGLYERIRGVALEVLRAVFGGIYSGYIGIDMLLYRDAAGRITVHPCVEINMRYTMGMVAIRLFRQYIHPEASGAFYVSYDKHAFLEHERMKAHYPLVIADGRIRSGYQTLCPVTVETHYRAFIIMEEKNDMGDF